MPRMLGVSDSSSSSSFGDGVVVPSSVEADCLSSDAVEDCVYITAAKVAGYYQVTKLDITTLGAYPAFGVIKSKSTATRCVVQTYGLMTMSFPLTPGAVYWVDVNAKPTDVPPVPGVGKSAVQSIGYAVDTTELLVQPSLTPTVRVA